MIEYDPHQWRDHLLDIKGSVLRKIAPRVLIVGVWAMAIELLVYNKWISLQIPSTAHSLVGVALGLLLVFRTNSSYDRFWEARRQWGAIVNATRNLTRQSSALLAGAPEFRTRVLNWTAAFPYSVMLRLRNGAGVDAAERWLPIEGVKHVRSSTNGPVCVATEIASAIAGARRSGVITDQEQILMDVQVGYLIDAAGACDRIHKTPLPFAYVVHLRRSLALYCGTLPFAMVKDFGWGQVIVTCLVSFVLLGIEEIGVEIEDPFGTDDNDLPLESFCANIARDVRGECDANAQLT